MKSDKDKLLRIMQYNFLADRLCTIKRYPHAKEFVRQFEWRGPMIMEEIKQADCDIVCVQELDRAADFYIEQFTNLGYNVLHESRPSILIKKEGLAQSILRSTTLHSMQYKSHSDPSRVPQIHPSRPESGSRERVYGYLQIWIRPSDRLQTRQD